VVRRALAAPRHAGALINEHEGILGGILPV
jgi:hypothetical protein